MKSTATFIADTNIALHGDITLIVGKNETRILAHSCLLRAASKIFSAILSPQWMEGQKMLQQGGSSEITLPDDDAQAMTYICAILHHREDLVPQQLDDKALYKVATHANKYDVVRAIKHVSRGWFMSMSKNSFATSLLPIAAAYLLQDLEAFGDLTRAIVLYHSGPMTTLAESAKSENIVLPLRFYRSLAEKRAAARRGMMEIVLRRTTQLLASCDDVYCNSSEWALNREAGLTYLSNTLGAWDIGAALLVNAQKFVDVGRHNHVANRVPVCNHCRGKYVGFDDKFDAQAAIDAITCGDYSLCLYCVQSDGECPSHRAPVSQNKRWSPMSIEAIVGDFEMI